MPKAFIGAHEIAGVVGYAFGNLHLDGYELPWEGNDFQYGKNFAHPREVSTFWSMV